MKNYLYLFALVLILSCGNLVESRIRLVEEELVVELPDNCVVEEEDYQSYNTLEGDYQINLRVRLLPIQADSIKIQLKSTPFFNRVNHLDGLCLSLSKGNGDSTLVKEYRNIIDSLSKNNLKGCWGIKGGSYHFIDFRTRKDIIVVANLDTVDHSLRFVYNQI